MTIVEQIVAGDIPAAIVYQSPTVIAFMDHDPINEGHILICPVAPICNFPDVPEPVMQEIYRVAKALYRQLETKYQPEGISFIQNNGHCNELDHFHLHIFPRLKGDGFAWSSYGLGQQETDQLRKQSQGLQLTTEALQ